MKGENFHFGPQARWKSAAKSLGISESDLNSFPKSAPGMVGDSSYTFKSPMKYKSGGKVREIEVEIKFPRMGKKGEMHECGKPIKKAMGGEVSGRNEFKRGGSVKGCKTIKKADGGLITTPGTQNQYSAMPPAVPPGVTLAPIQPGATPAPAVNRPTPHEPPFFLKPFTWAAKGFRDGGKVNSKHSGRAKPSKKAMGGEVSEPMDNADSYKKGGIARKSMLMNMMKSHSKPSMTVAKPKISCSMPSKKMPSMSKKSFSMPNHSFKFLRDK